MSGLTLVQTVCKGYQQTTKCLTGSGFKLLQRLSADNKNGQRVLYKKLVDTTFWLKPWLKIISFGYNFFHLAKVLATTNSEPEIALLFIIGLYMFFVLGRQEDV